MKFTSATIISLLAAFVTAKHGNDYQQPAENGENGWNSMNTRNAPNGINGLNGSNGDSKFMSRIFTKTSTKTVVNLPLTFTADNAEIFGSCAGGTDSINVDNIVISGGAAGCTFDNLTNLTCELVGLAVQCTVTLTNLSEDCDSQTIIFTAEQGENAICLNNVGGELPFTPAIGVAETIVPLATTIPNVFYPAQCPVGKSLVGVTSKSVSNYTGAPGTGATYQTNNSITPSTATCQFIIVNNGAAATSGYQITNTCEAWCVEDRS